MGVLTPLPSTMKWKPEDDLILKNAVEGGASLESLAKGAVQFSRKFTLRELQERWYSLLFDLKTAESASALIIDLENEHSVPNFKAGRIPNFKGKDNSSSKRKADTVKRHYYAMRKKMLLDPCTVNRDIPAVPFPLRNANGYVCGYRFNFQDQNTGDDACLAPHLLDHYGHQGLSYDDDILRFTPLGNGNNSGHVFHPDCLDSVKVAHKDEMVDHDYEKGYTENTSLPLVYAAGLDTLENECIRKDSSEFLEEINGTGKLLTDKHCNDKLLEEEFLPTPGLNKDNACNFVGKTNASLQVESGDSVHQLDCLSSAATLSLWEADAPTETMSVSLDLDNKLALGVQDGNDLEASVYDGLIAGASKKTEQPDVGCHDNAISSESSLMGFSTPCLDFSDNQELFYLNVDDKDLAGASCLNGLSPIILSSPSSSNPNDMQKLGDPEEMDNFKAPKLNPEACSERTIESCNHETIMHDGSCNKNNYGENMPSVSPNLCITARLSEGLVLCVLNTEDQEIPDNNDVFLPAQGQIRSPVSASSTERKCSVGNSPMIKEEWAPSTHIYPLKAKSSSSKNVGVSFNAHSASEHFIDSVLADNGPKSPVFQAAALQSGLNVEAPSLNKPSFFGTSMNLWQERLSPILQHNKLHSQSCANGYSKEMGVQMRPQKCGPYLEQVAVPGSTSDQEDHGSDMDNDIPSFADVEAMILDMDLGPDQESCFFTVEALRCQSVHSKKTIVRLEQGARAYAHRAFQSHGAFAVLYGHNLKYFIRNPEVSLGRATNDSKVDIDLTKEGRANAISRRQAVIKMEKDGSFILKNIGKHSIYVNSNEVPAKKRINLCSGSLIEIRALRFIFEVNQMAVRRYITMKSGQGSIEEYEWKP